MMDRRMAESLDRHITGNYGEDQFSGVEPHKCTEACKKKLVYQGEGVWTCPDYDPMAD